MIGHFRLCRATTRSTSSKFSAPSVSVDFSSKLTDDAENAISVIIGSNGTGKSRLLGAVADTFAYLNRRSYDARLVPLETLSYVVDGVTITSRSGPGDTFDSYPVAPRAQLPRRVIAVAMTPFDKFPLGPNLPSDSDEDYSTFYHYIGMRDRQNRASVTALLYRAIENLLERKDRGSRARIAEVFRLLGYQPRVSVKLNLNLNPDQRHQVTSGAPLLPILRNRGPAFSFAERRIERGIVAEDDIRAAILSLLPHIEKGRTAHVEIDLSSGAENYSGVDVRSLSLLRSLGLIRLREVNVCRGDGVTIDLKQASSGEISIFTTFLSIAGVLQDSSLVLIDEPETSLHPEWQARFLDLLRRTFANYHGCHFILSTHSPLIVADIPETAGVFSLDRQDALSGEELSGKSSDFLLATVFDTPSTGNYFVRDELVRALRMAADGESNSAEFARTVNLLESIGKNLPQGEPTLELIRELSNAKREIPRDN